MLQNYLLITLRNLKRNRVFIFINIIGMGVAIACCIVAYLNWQFSASFDSMHTRTESVYRVQSWYNTSDSKNRYATVPNALGEIIRQNVPDVRTVVQYNTSQSDIRIGDEVFNTSVAYADSSFFELFTFIAKSGSLNGFQNKACMVISETVARKYFDDINVEGKTITQINHGKLKEFTIAGVFEDQPLNSSFGFEAITLWDNYFDTTLDGRRGDADWISMSTLFVQIPDENRVQSVARQLQVYLEPQNRAREDFKLSSYYLQNFKTMASHFYGEGWLNSEQLRWGIPPSATIGPAVMASLLLLLACFNFTNTALSTSRRRLKEIGIRKTMGGVRSQLIFQFLNESVVMCFLALLTGLLLAGLLIPAYNALWPGIKLSLNYTNHVAFLAYLVALLLMTALLAGIYPAFYVTSFKPATILKGKMKLGATNWFTRTLLALQFTIALICLVSGIAFIRNAGFQNDYDLGYAKSGIVTVPVSNEGEFSAFRNLLVANKDISRIAGSRNHVSDGYEKATVNFEAANHDVEVVDVGSDYLEAMDIRLVAGRAFEKDSYTDEKESVLISEAFVASFGWTDNPIGKRILWRDSVALYVIGVVRNIHTEGFWKPVAPVMLRYTATKNYRQLVVKTSPENIIAVNDFMKQQWKKVSPNTVYGGRITDGNLYASAMINKNTISIFGFLGVIAVLMSATGLYALVSLNIARKMKEIGVRKMLGASAIHIARVINLEFMVILLFASIIGGAVGYFASEKMMDAIWEYYVQSGIITIITAISSLLGVAVLTVAYKTVVTSLSNPIHALRED